VNWIKIACSNRAGGTKEKNVRQIDADVMMRTLPVWAHSIGDIKNIAASSPTNVELDILKTMFPSANIESFDKNQWNLDNVPLTEKKFDLYWANAVFMCAKDPALWLKNVFSACENAWIADMIEGWRCGPNGSELALNDGDVMRYHVQEERAAFDGAYDLEKCCVIIDKVVYKVNGPKPTNRSFIAWLKRKTT